MKTKILILTMALIVFGAVFAGAQQEGRVRLQNAYNKTQDVIERAKEAVMESGSIRARNQLEMAIKLQNLAGELLRSDDIVYNDAMALRAGRYTLGARDKAQKAIAITLQAAENEDYVRRRLQSADEMIRRIENEAGPDIPPGLRAMLDSAREKQQRAREFFRNRRLKASLQLTLQVEKALKKIIDRVGGYRLSADNYQAQTDRYLSLKERIERFGDSEGAQIRLRLEEAERFRKRADDLAVDGRYGRAEKEIGRAVEILSRTAENLRQPAKIEAALKDIKKQAKIIGREVDQIGQPENRRQYRTALEHIEKAEALHKNNEHELAAARLQAARQLLARISDRLGRSSGIEEAIALLKSHLEMLRERVRPSGDGRLQNDLNDAGDFIARASEAYRAGETEAARAHLELARNKMDRVSRALGD